MKLLSTIAAILISLSAQAQNIFVADTGLGAEMCDELPLAMNAACDSVDTVAAAANYSTGNYEFSANNQEVYDASVLVHFPRLDTISLTNNNLTSFPSLTNWPILHRIRLAENNLTVGPDILSPGTDSLEFVYLHVNEIDTLPGYDMPDSKIKVLDLRSNRLRYIPQFENWTELRRLNVRENYLWMEDLIPLKSNPRWLTSIWQLFPQRPFETGMDAVKNIGDDWLIAVPHGHASNTYYLFQDSVLIDSSTDGTFTLMDIQKSDEATYYVEIRNSEFSDPSRFLSSLPFDLLVADPHNKNDVQLISPDGNGVGDFILIEGSGSFEIYNKAGSVIFTQSLPFSWYGTNQQGGKVQPGLYVIKKGEELVKVLVSY